MASVASSARILSTITLSDVDAREFRDVNKGAAIAVVGLRCINGDFGCRQRRYVTALKDCVMTVLHTRLARLISITPRIMANHSRRELTITLRTNVAGRRPATRITMLIPVGPPGLCMATTGLLMLLAACARPAGL